MRGSIAIIVILSDMAAGRIACTRIGGPLLFGRIWERLGIAEALDELLQDRGFEFASLPSSAVFASVLHRLFVSGSDRSCEKRMADYWIAAGGEKKGGLCRFVTHPPRRSGDLRQDARQGARRAESGRFQDQEADLRGSTQTCRSDSGVQSVNGPSWSVNERIPRLLGLGSGDKIEQLGRDLGLASLPSILAQLFQLFRHIVVGGLHCRETCRVFAGKGFDGGFGQLREDVIRNQLLQQFVRRQVVKRWLP